MNVSEITQYLTQYGMVAVFVIVFLEYLNLPGFPAGIIMPVAGICAAQGGVSFGMTLFLSVLAGLCGSLILYMLGRLGGTKFLSWFARKFPKQTPALDKTIDLVRSKGYMGLFVAKLLPAIRTIISIPAGVVRMDLAGYTLFSTLGIFFWNLVFIGSGYFFGDAVLGIFK